MPIIAVSPEKFESIKALLGKDRTYLDDYLFEMVKQFENSKQENDMPPISPALVVAKFGPILKACTDVSMLGYEMQERFEAGDESCLDKLNELKKATMHVVEQIQTFESAVCNLTNPDLKKTKFKFRYTCPNVGDIIP
jgi:hypothetical protein